MSDEVGSLHDDLLAVRRTISHLQQQLDATSLPQKTLVAKLTGAMFFCYLFISLAEFIFIRKGR